MDDESTREKTKFYYELALLLTLVSADLAIFLLIILLFIKVHP